MVGNHVNPWDTGREHSDRDAAAALEEEKLQAPFKQREQCSSACRKISFCGCHLAVAARFNVGANQLTACYVRAAHACESCARAFSCVTFTGCMAGAEGYKVVLVLSCCGLIVCMLEPGVAAQATREGQAWLNMHWSCPAI